MAGTLTGLRLSQAILNGTLSSGQLETLLTTDADTYLGPWKILTSNKTFKSVLDKATAFDVVLGSNTAFSSLLDTPSSAQTLASSLTSTQQICKNGNAILTLLGNATYYGYWLNVPVNYTNLKAQVNAVGSKITSQSYGSSGTFTLPVGLLALSLLAIGSGGTGAGASLSRAGGGAGGGGVACKEYLAGLPTNNLTITIGGGNYEILENVTSLIKAFSGQDGVFVGTPSSSPGNGGTATGPSGSLLDVNVDSSFWNKNFTTSGANGGYGTTFNGSGSAGSAGLTGAGGAGGYYDGVSTIYGGQGGTGISSGGGGGAANASAGNINEQGGGGGSGIGCGGGAGSSDSYQGSSGGTGSPGLIRILAIVS